MALTVPASALEYNIDGPGDPEYGTSTSVEPVVTADRGEMLNVDVSKNAALIPPTFGSPSAYTPEHRHPADPNLAPGYMMGEGAIINGSAGITVAPPDFGSITFGGTSTGGTTTTPGTSTPSTGYTEVTSDLYYSGGYLATLKIPSLNVNVKVYEGTTSTILAKGRATLRTPAFGTETAPSPVTTGVRMVSFGSIHNLNVGDTITLTTKLGTRTYSVTSVNKISETDNSPAGPHCRELCHAVYLRP